MQTGVIATVKTPGAAIDVAATDLFVATAEGASGVSLFSLFKGSNLTILAHVPTAANALRVACSGNFIAVAANTAGLLVIDATSPAEASIVHQVSLNGAQAVTASGGTVWVGASSGRILEVGLSTGTVLASLSLPAAVVDLALEGDFLYGLTADHLYVISLANQTMTQVGSVNSPFVSSPNQRLFVGGGMAYAVHGKGYNTIDLSDPAKPVLLTAGNTTQFGWRHIAANGSGLGVAAVGPVSSDDSQHNISLYDLSDPKTNNVYITTFPTPGVASAVSIFNGLAYVADGGAGLEVLNYLPYDNKGVPPTISLVPAFSSGKLEEGTLTYVSASVHDDVQVRNVEFYLNDVKAFTDGAFPFEFRFVTPALNATNSTFRLRARAFDTGGNSTWSDELTVTLTPDTTPPRVSKVIPEFGDRTVTQVLAFFNEPLNAALLTPESLRLFSAGPDGKLGTADDQVVSGDSISYEDALHAVSVNLAQPLPIGLYRGVAGLNIADLAGNRMATNYTWDFPVADAVFWIKKDDGDWADPLNWATGAVPGTNDNVVIDVPLNITISLSHTTISVKTISLNNRLLVNGGTIRANAITQMSNGNLQFLFAGNVLDGVTLDGPLNVANGPSLAIRNGLRLTTKGVAGGTIRIDNIATLGFEGTQTFGPAIIELAGSGTLGISGAGTLTLDTNVLIHGVSGIVGPPVLNANGAQMLINRGIISADGQNPFVGFTINPKQFQNYGTVSATNRGKVSITGFPWNNAGELAVADGSTLSLAGQWTNTGVITVTNGTLNLGSDSRLTVASIGQIDRSGGTVRLATTLDNNGTVLALDPSTGPWVLSDAVIRGGLVTQSGGASLQFGGAVLDGVTLDGGLDLTGGGLIRIVNGLHLTHNGVPGGNVRIDNRGTIGFQGTQTFGPATVSFEHSGGVLGITGAGTLTLSSGVLVHGTSGEIGEPVFDANGAQTLVNQGTISADVAGGTLTVSPTQFENPGTLRADGAGASVMIRVNPFTNTRTIQELNGGRVLINP